MHRMLASCFLSFVFVVCGMVVGLSAETCPTDAEIDFGQAVEGDRYGVSEYVDVGGFSRLKLVADGFPGVWGTWVGTPVEEELLGFDLSFRFSLKNLGGGPGDGFSFLWGDLSDPSGLRMSGGEWGIQSFLEDGSGLSVGFRSYPDAGGSGVAVRWGGVDAAFAAFDFGLVRYDDYVQAGDPTNMATARIRWRRETGATVTIALPTFPPEILHLDVAQDITEGIDPRGWSFGFAARNGAIDQDVLIGDLRLELETACPGLAADLNGDCLVDGGDVGILLSAWGSCGPTSCVGDIDRNDVVDGADIGALLGAWGLEACPSESPSERLVMRPRGTTIGPQGYWEYLPADYDSRDDWALMVFLHGVGANGDGTSNELERILSYGPPSLMASNQWPVPGTAAPDEFVMVAPQNGGDWCHDPVEVRNFIEFAVQVYGIDLERVYLTGLSCGGVGAWEYLRIALDDDRIAAAVPICGDGEAAWNERGCELGQVPIWAFHGDQDDVILPSGSLIPMGNLATCRKPAAVDARLTMYPGVGHDSWTRTYDLTAGHDIYAWLLSHRNTR